MEIDRELFGHNIRMLLAMKGITRIQLAQQAGINRSSLYFVEKGKPVRVSTLKKICTALEVDFTMTCTVRQTLNIKPKDQPYAVHVPEETIWYEWGEHRRTVPPDNHALIQDPKERARLGRTGLVSVFLSGASFIMPEGPGYMYLEIFGPYESGIGAAQYKDGMLHCLRGEIYITIAGDKVHMKPGMVVGYDNNLEMRFQPVKPVGPNELPPLLLWMGANRVGKILS